MFIGVGRFRGCVGVFGEPVRAEMDEAVDWGDGGSSTASESFSPSDGSLFESEGDDSGVACLLRRNRRAIIADRSRCCWSHGLHFEKKEFGKSN